MSVFSQGQVMLSLSLLSYRGFWNPKTDKQQAMASTLAAGLEQLETLRGDWKLVWGPGSYRYLGSAFDSSLMYVVQHTRQPSRYAIVVRGTNPVDMFDWLLGDFLPHRQVPWRSGDIDVAPGAKISLSTALGLKILLNMRAETDPGHTPGPGKFDFLLDLGARAVSSSKDGGQAAMSAAEKLMDATAVTPAYDKARELVSELLSYQKIFSLAEQVSSSAASILHNLLQGDEMMRMLSVRRRLVGMLDDSRDQMTETPAAMLMPGPDELRAMNLPGIGLLELLGSLSARHGDDLELFVTGHSKGGALAPVLAQFLADTQRNDELAIAPHYQWSPHSRAQIHCYAFAGPTPGNDAFASYFNQQLGRNFYRYANQLDIVTHAWRSEQLRKVAQIYGDAVSAPPGLDLLFTEMADEVEGLDYCHPGEDYQREDAAGTPLEKHVVEFSGPLRENNPSYLLQEIHQHVGAYIELLGLGKLIDLKDLIGTDMAGRVAVSP